MRNSNAVQGYLKSKQTKDSRFGDVYLYQNKELRSSLFCKEKVVNTKELAHQEIESIKRRMDLNHVNLLRLVDYQCILQTSLCSKSFLIQTFYEVPETDLSKIQKKKQQELTTFSEDQLRQVYDQIGEGIRRLHSANQIHGDVSPLMIGLRSDSSQYYLMDRLRDSSPDLAQSLQSNIFNKFQIFMMPELYQKIKGKRKEPIGDLK